MNPFSIALRGKGAFNLLRRSARIAYRYGLTPEKLQRALSRLAALAAEFNCRPTFPITSVVLRRHPRLIRAFQDAGAEFAIHGLYHVDYSALTRDEQRAHLAAAQEIFARAGVQAKGFRGPYLRRNGDTSDVVRELGLLYDASPAYAWEVVNGAMTPAYGRVLEFFRAQPAARHVVTPSLAGGLVSMPYSLPDDESLVERLDLPSGEAMSRVWVEMQRAAYARGELLTLGLHPERTDACYMALRAVLAEARAQTPPVWLARLDEIAQWWQARAQAKIVVQPIAEGEYRVTVSGPAGVTALVRSLTVKAATAAWADGYQRTPTASFVVESPVRPVISLSPQAAPFLADFLQQQGYIAEISPTGEGYAFHIHEPEDQRTLVDAIEAGRFPLVRLGRWPAGARSALAVTGDIDALTLWDYGLRFIER